VVAPARPALGTLVVLATAYFVAAKLGLHLAFLHPSATPVWPPTGIALAASLRLGYRVWPAILAGAFCANLTTAGSVLTSLGIACGNTLEGLVGAWLVRRFAGGVYAFERPLTVFRFAVLAGLVSTVLSATVGVTSLALGGFAAWDRYPAVWLTWWLGDAGGDLLVAPLLLLWGRRQRPPVERRRSEAALLLALPLLVGFTVFGGWLPWGIQDDPVEFLSLPPLLLVAFRLGQLQAAAATALLSGVAIWGTVSGYGPFSRGSPNESLLLLEATSPR